MERILIFTGKGGVGKTSTAAAHALMSAKEGKKTLLVSTDMAHNLSDLFGQSIGREEKKIAPFLYGLEIDPDYMMEHEYAELTKAILNMLISAGTSMESLGEGITVPGMDELFALLKILDIYESGSYDRMIVDCAPTGETLSLLKFPELLCWYMEKFFPIGKMAMRVLSPVSKKLFSFQLPHKEAMNDVERLYAKLVQLQELLRNREVTSVRLVALPEKMVVEETKRNYMYLNLYGYHVDGVYVNRVLPEDLKNPFFGEWLKIQKQYIQELEAIFGEVPMTKIPWYEQELCGMEALDRVCREILAGRNLFSLNQIERGEYFEKTDQGYRLVLFIPGLTKEKLDMYQNGTDVILKVGNFKRNIPLPNALRCYQITGAGMRERELYVNFERQEGDPQAFGDQK